AAGVHTFTVEDANGCTTTVDVTITQPAAALSATGVQASAVSCFGFSDGSATITPAGGTAGYTITPAQTGLAAGVHTFTVEDANGCTTTVDVTITQPAVLSASASQNSPVVCNGESNGSATVTPAGGNGGYTYLWDNGETTATATALNAGSHSVTITDSQGCQTSTSVTITQPAVLSASLISVTNVSCFGSNDGAININVSGGTTAYSFNWSNGASSQDISNIPAGTYNVTITDANNCTFDINGISVGVADNTPPTITCPGDISVNNDPGQCTAVVTYSAPTANDNCGVDSITRISGPASGSAFPVGTTTVTYEVEDTNGNTETCSFTVTVNDNEPPVAQCKDYTIILDSDGLNSQGDKLNTNDINDGSYDNCGGVSVSFANGWNGTIDCNDVGVIQVDLIVTDSAGNTSTCTANVTVVDDIPPTAICRATPLIVQLDNTGNYTLDPALLDNGSNDGANPCGVTLSLSQSTFDCTDVGSNTVTLTATDGGGNTDTCDVTVIVEDNVQPTAVCQAYTVYLDANGNGSLTAADIDGGSTDACDIVNWSASQTTYDCSDLGLNSVRLTVTDTNGNSAQCFANVTVVDNIPPVAPNLTDVLWGCDYTPTTPTTIDNCTSGTIIGNPNTTFPITTTTTITWTFTDNAGNSSTSSQTITIDPVVCNTAVTQHVSCFGGSDGIATVTGSGGNGPYTYDWGGLDPNALAAGTHTVTITDSEGCSSTCTVSITEPTQLTSSITAQTGVTCFDNPIGSVTVAGANGTGPYTYSLDGGTYQSNGAFSGLTGGAHTVTVRDNNGCTVDQAVTIAGPTEALIADVQLTNEGCSQDGSIGVEVVGQGGNGAPYQYRMNGGAWTNNGDFGGQPDGTYTFQVQDASGCLSAVETVDIVDSTPVKVVIPTWQDVDCYGEATGSANSVATSGKAPYTYLWSNGQTTADATGLIAGTYSLTVTDFNGCTATATVTIDQATEIIISETHTDVTCNGGSNGSITISASGGTPGYQYNINNGLYGASNLFSGLTAGTYLMGVLDANLCEKQINVIISEPSQINATYTTDTVGCAGGNNGTATVTASGGTPGYTYLWSNGQTGITATGLAPGSHSVTITDANNCVLIQNVTYSDPAALTVAMSTTVTSGVGNSDGTATATPSGGVGPYTYLWSPGGQTTATATGLSQGSYTVTVTDSNNCQVTETIIVADIIDINITYEAACDPNISVDLQRLYIRLLDELGTPLITGGYGNLTYTWNFGSNVDPALPVPANNLNDNSTKEIVYLVGGNKTIVLSVTDESGQTVNYSFNEFIDSCIEFDVDCYRCVSQDYQLLDWYIGDEFGNKLPSCGTPGTIIPNDIYIWFFLDHGDNTNYNLNVVAEYVTTHPLTGEVTVESIEECLYEGEKIGTGAAYLFIDNNYVCGSTIEISKFLISWTKLAKTPCGQRTPKCFCPGFDIAVGSPLTAIATATDISCYAGTNNGTATVDAFGGTEPYSYLWTTSDGSGLNPTAKDQTGLSPGTYTVTVTDSNTTYDPDLEMEVSDPYTFTTSVTVGEPPELTIDSFDPNVPPCHGGSNGYAQANVSGGTAPYTYSWSNGQTTQTATNLSAGTYTVTVTDANGCTDSDSLTITDPPLLTASATGTEPLCFGNSNGTATVTPAGGTPGYTYLWSSGQTTQTATGLASGSYSVTVTDANNCTATTSVSIGQPTALDASTTKTDVTCNNAADGTATINVTGGTAPYTYLWSNGQTNQTATGLIPGTYNVVATDSNNCTIARNITITQPTLLVVGTGFTEPNCYNGANGGTATVNASGGTAPYTYLWSNGQTTQTANNLAQGTYSVTVTDANSCTETASVDVTLPLQTFANAGLDQDLSAENCGVITTVLSATGVDSEGTTLPGSWSIVSGTGGSFSDVTDPNAIFTGQAGVTYELQYAITCAQDNVIITFGVGCNTLDFDGDNDHVTFQNQYNVGGNFSFEIWVKPDPNQNGGGANNPIQTIFSKRDATTLADGYDLRLEGTNLSFRYNNAGTISASHSLGTSRWYHVAVTYDGTDYFLYVDGIQVGTGSGSAPILNSDEFMLGAMDQNPAGGNPNPVNYYSGWMQELRIWNTALTVEQIRQMMNQTITNNGTATRGTVVPIDVAGLNWASLSGYYRMLQPAALSGTGYLLSTFGIGSDGQMRNIETTQEETAPLPYESDEDGNWNDVNTANNDGASPWEWGHSVWDHPNSTGINGASIDWNIVRTSHDIVSNTQDVTLLGLLVDSNELTITDNSATQNETTLGHGLWITHYLRLDGLIDLIGESQLVQKKYGYYDHDGNQFTKMITNQVSESILEVNSSGYIERDQQGTNNPFNYNYWGSPVGPRITGTNNNARNVNAIMKDGSNTDMPKNISWTGAYTAATSDPIQLSTRWVYTYENYTTNTYANWRTLGSGGNFNAGLGHIMKGSGKNYVAYNIGTQNYVFTGKPNNNIITTPINDGFDALIGNPYPSAIDANVFLLDNGPYGTNTISGALYFWEHYVGNNTHILAQYEGGYAVLNFVGGLPAVTPPPTAEGYTILGGPGTKRPERYVPVGQGFFVTAADAGSNGNGTGGQIEFNNSQRIFVREHVSASGGLANTGSVFLKSSNGKGNKNNVSPPPAEDTTDDIKRLRIDFKTPEGAIRQLLLGFVPNNMATDNFDYGYDAPKYNNLPNDLTWMINGEGYEIQGIGEFDETKLLQLGLYLSTSGNIEISLNALDGLDPNTKVYIYDSLLGTYVKINNKSFEMNLEAGEYLNRFFLTFQKNNTLSTYDNMLESVIGINYLQNTKELYIKTPDNVDISQVYLTNILGQTIKSWNVSNTPNLSSNEIKIPINNVSEGTYIVKVETLDGTANQKIVIGQ
uniref:HYR domain-containing protein n=1 Tax=Seonamhaeicola maritimus TaxID=2591822 RepID=UPI0024943FFA